MAPASSRILPRLAAEARKLSAVGGGCWLLPGGGQVGTARRNLSVGSNDELGALLADAAAAADPRARDALFERLRPEVRVDEVREAGQLLGLALRHPAASSGPPLAQLLLQEDVLHSCVAHAGLPVSCALPLVERALRLRDDGRSMNALVALRGLCGWVADGERWAAFPEEAAGAAQAMALGRPRPGHSVLGIGTFRAAEPAWMALASEYVGCVGDAPGDGVQARLREEVAMYVAAGARVQGPLHLADTSEAALKGSGGAMLHLTFD